MQLDELHLHLAAQLGVQVDRGSSIRKTWAFDHGPRQRHLLALPPTTGRVFVQIGRDATISLISAISLFLVGAAPFVLQAVFDVVPYDMVDKWHSSGILWRDPACGEVGNILVVHQDLPALGTDACDRAQHRGLAAA